MRSFPLFLGPFSSSAHTKKQRLSTSASTGSLLDVGRYGHIPQHPSATAGGRIVVMLVVVTNVFGLTVGLLYGILDTAYPTLSHTICQLARPGHFGRAGRGATTVGSGWRGRSGSGPPLLRSEERRVGKESRS